MEVAEYIAKKTVINVHARGNCSVVCMQRLPYDLQRDALRADTIQGHSDQSEPRSIKECKNHSQ